MIMSWDPAGRVVMPPATAPSPWAHFDRHDIYISVRVQAYLLKKPVNFGQLLWRNAKGLEAWMSMGSLSYGLERAPSRLVFGKAL